MSDGGAGDTRQWFGGGVRSANDADAWGADETEFLLRSIEDLHQQRAAGELDEPTYRRLLDDYTVQAAAALRVQQAAEEQAPPEPIEDAGKRRRRRWPVPAALAGVAVVALALLPAVVGQRGSGDTITGNAQTRQSAQPSTAQLARLAEQRPEDPDAQLMYARALLADRELVEAIKAYDRAAELDPTNPEPAAYHGWIVLLAGLPDEAMPYLDRAIRADPTYPDAHFFRAMALRDQGKTARAVGELDRYLRLAPADDPMRSRVKALRDQLRPRTSTTNP